MRRSNLHGKLCEDYIVESLKMQDELTFIGDYLLKIEHVECIEISAYLHHNFATIHIAAFSFYCYY